MTEREAFEAWALRDYPRGNIQWDRDTPFRAQSAGAVTYAMYSEWKAWQAAAARYGPLVDVSREVLSWLTNEPNVWCSPSTIPERLRQALAALDGAK